MGELMQQYIDEAEQDLLHTYNRYQVVLDRGDGVSLYDIEGKRYLDFVAGIAVFALGYHNAEYNDALKAQIDKVIHTSNYYYNVPAVEAARHLKKVSRMDRVFFTNSGAEAIEGAIKAARKYAYLKDGTTDHEIIAMNHSFHGRTMGALSVTVAKLGARPAQASSQVTGCANGTPVPPFCAKARCGLPTPGIRVRMPSGSAAVTRS